MATWSATRVLGSGTFGRVYGARKTELVPELAEFGVVYSMPGLVLKESFIGTASGLREDGAGDIKVETGGGEECDPDCLPDEYEGLPVGGSALVLRGPSARSREESAWQALSGTVVPHFHGAAFVIDGDGGGSLGAGVRGGNTVDSQETASPSGPHPDPSVRLVMGIEHFGGSLYDFAYQHPDRVSEPFLLEVCRQTLAQLARLHAAGWMHRDLKPHNILIDDTVGGFPLIRLCDLGACKDMRVTTTASGRAMMHAPYNMARYYRAPELLCGSATYTVAADMWAIAVTLAEVTSITAILRNRALGPVQHRGTGCRPQRTDPVITGSSSVADPVVVRHVRGSSTLFHGATNDGAQLLHIINLLGLPSEGELADMRLHPLCRQRFLALASIIAGRSAAQATARPPVGMLGLAYRAIGMAGGGGGGVGVVPALPLLQPDGHPVNFLAPIKERFDYTTSAVTPAVGGGGGEAGGGGPGWGMGDVAVTPLKAGRGEGAGGGEAGRETVGAPWLDLVPSLGAIRMLMRMGVSPALSSLLACLLRWGPSDRLTAVGALRHPALAGGRHEDLEALLASLGGGVEMRGA